jgi:hypothetical protein
MAAGLVFLLVGYVGALWGVHGVSRPVVLTRPSRLATAAVTVVVVGILGAGGALAALRPPSYYAQGTALFEPPSPVQNPPLASSGRGSMAASLIHDVMESSEERDRLATSGVPDYDVAIGNGSLMMGSDRQGSGGPLMLFLVRAPNPTTADRGLQILLKETGNRLTGLQAQIGIPTTEWVQLRTVGVNGAYPVAGRQSRAAAAVGLLALFVACCLIHVVRRSPDEPGGAHEFRSLPTRSLSVP